MTTVDVEHLDRRRADLLSQSDAHVARMQAISLAAAAGDSIARAEFAGLSDANRLIETELTALKMARDQLCGGKTR